MGASAKIVLFKGKKYTDETHPVYLQVTINRKNKYYSIGNNLKCKSFQWGTKDNKNEFNKRFANHARANIILKEEHNRASEILLELENKRKVFTHDDFNRRYLTDNKLFYFGEYTDSIIKRLLKAGNAGNSDAYKTAKSVFISFLGSDKLMNEISRKDLEQFIEYSREIKRKPNTISNYLRTIRAVFNRAIKEENFDYYPFKDFNWKQFNVQTAKRALTKEQVHSLFNVDVKKSIDLLIAQKVFKFIYYCHGINFHDIALLEQKNINQIGTQKILEYNRAKGGKLYQVPLGKEALDILNYFIEKQETKYIFPFLHEHIHINPRQIKTRIKTAEKKVNASLKTIAKFCGIETNMTTYVARHTLAAVLIKEGYSLEVVQDILGHEDPKTTRIYVKGLTFSEKMEINKKL